MRKLLKAQGLLAALMLLATASPAFSQGVFTAGDLWDTFNFAAADANARTYYSENAADPNKLYNLMRIGNLDRQWTSPTFTYPGGENIHLPWGQDMEMIEYNPDPNFNHFTTSSNPKAKNYAFGIWRAGLGAATIDNAAHYVDANNRHHMIYEGTTPTSLGVTVKFRMQQWTLNHANMNDFIVMEFELTNTGVLDVDADGTPEKTDNKINALVLNWRNEPINSMTNSASGRRGASGWFTGVISGYDATPNPQGNPWNVPLIFSGPSPSTIVDGWAPDGARALGITMNRRKVYYDIYNGFRWIAAKQGPMNPLGSTVSSPDKKTIYDSPAVGEGTQAGWFSSVLKDYGGRDAQEHHNLSMGVFFNNGGRIYDRAAFDLSPDPNWFDPTHPDVVTGDPLSFVNAVRPEGTRGQPKGDMKYTGTFVQNWEKNNPDPADDWTDGYSIQHNFDGTLLTGIGPLSLEVGETVTLTFVEYGGFRLQGVRNASKAAQWAFDNDWNVPAPPPTPDLSVQPNTNKKIDIKWDARAESAPDFAGYKIYRSTAFPKVNSLEIGTMRLADTYHTQTQAEPSDAQLAALGKPNNPNISYDGYKEQEPNASGPYHLVKMIPKAELGSYLNDGTDSGTYKYKFEDPSDLVAFGFKYWYYVAAYDNESGEIAGVPYTTLETHRNNFNGSAGIWQGTYYYATAASLFPSDLQGLKDIGAEFILKAPLVNPTELVNGNLKIRVSPNPYKKQALHDTGTEHKLLFTNLPTGTKITILDVSGQVIDVLKFDGTNPFDGTLFWDMFSKDGIEVTSGLYIYVAEYPGGKQVSHFSILR